MAVVYAFLADGLEEVECLATADVLIRAGVKVKLVSITGKKEVKGSHGFGIHADTVSNSSNRICRYYEGFRFHGSCLCGWNGWI